INGTTRHVGIYLDKNRFLHASKSSGVMISELDSTYWQSAYWKAKRIL
ncbi:MAG: NlpC/P60 family protein, partial [Sedimenticola sp.]|nr:NlpC/P60 family protein [Sedimenticola sp.]